MSEHDLLAGLNEQQREAARTLRGPVAIIAGAGTGKTRTITHRIAYGVHTGAYDPDRVLALSFTKKAAGELQTRLRGLDVSGIRSQTFHSAALAQLNYFWSQTVGGKPPQLVPRKLPNISQAAESLRIRIDPETARDIADEIEWRKVSMKTVDEYAELAHDRALPQSLSVEHIVDIMRRYEQLNSERRTIDFEDVLILMSGMIEQEPKVGLEIREQYRFFTVDEFQDVSPLQHTLLQGWIGERDDVCVVGDASQTIYSFTGATSRYLTRFEHDHPNAQVLQLEHNYRSSEEILAVANRLMRDQPGALQLVAKADPRPNTTPEKPLALWFRDELAEAAGVAAAIAEQIRGGTQPSDIAVLARTNAQLGAVETALAAEGVSSQTYGAVRFFERAEIKQAVMEIRAQSVVPDGRPSFQVVSDVARGLGWSQTPPDSVAERDKWNALQALVLLAEHHGDRPLRQLSEELLQRQRAGDHPTVNAVTLTAIHSAKGLEWPVVYVIGAAEGLLPIHYAKALADISEERRLAYVAFTRAQRALRISGSGGGLRQEREPSRFLQEAGIKLRHVNS